MECKFADGRQLSVNLKHQFRSNRRRRFRVWTFPGIARIPTKSQGSLPPCKDPDRLARIPANLQGSRPPCKDPGRLAFIPADLQGSRPTCKDPGRIARILIHLMVAAVWCPPCTERSDKNVRESVLPLCRASACLAKSCILQSAAQKDIP